MNEEREEIEKNLDANINWWSYHEFADEVISGLENIHYLLVASAALLMFACLIASFGANGYQVIIYLKKKYNKLLKTFQKKQNDVMEDFSIIANRNH